MNNTTTLLGHYYVRVSCSLLTILAGVPLNLLIIIAYWRGRSLHDATSNLLISNQAAVDLFNAVFCTADVVVSSDADQDTPRYHTVRTVATFSVISSLLYFTLIGCERLFAIARPMVYRVRVTRSGTKLRIATVWIVSALLR